MKKTQSILILFFLLISFRLFAQIALNGTAQKFPYSGLQPDLINGVSALQAINEALLRHVYLIDTNIISFTIDERAVILSNQKPYSPEESDTILMEGYHKQSKVLMRNGKRIGYLCGIHNEWLRLFNEIAGEKLDLNWISNMDHIAICSSTDKNYKLPENPLKIYRKSFPVDRTHTAIYQEFPMRHEIYCVLPRSILPGNSYTIHFLSSGTFSDSVVLKFDDQHLRSEAIHVNLYGFLPWEKKIAFVSTWLGDGGKYSYGRDLPFKVVAVETDNIVYEGKSRLKYTADEPEYTIGDRTFMHNKTDVLALDFSDLTLPGNYRIVVEGIGCSFDFEINPTTMESISRLIMKGFLHQRSGIELGPPYTDYTRPRNMYPDGNYAVHKCDANLFFNPPGVDNANGQQGIFQRIQASLIEDSEVPEAWGGWMDAGDFDQRMNHFYSVRRMMYLFELNPAFFENFHLGIPESLNTIPDILDEAKWSLDLQRRTQGVYEEGGISWWVESIEHPRQGETSWLQSLPTALVPPTPRASLNYAATAAQMALILKKYDPELAGSYLNSALSAIHWTDNHPDTPDLFGTFPRPLIEAMAYLNLYRCTGDYEWHKKFEAVLPRAFEHGIVEDASARTIELCVNYLLIKDLKKDQNIVDLSKKAILKIADALVAGSKENTYAVLKPEGWELNRMASFSGLALPLAFAHWITADMKYAETMAGGMQYLLGANPMNRCYISGLGDRWFGPYQLDWESNNVSMPSGIPTFGPIKITETNWGWQGNYGIKAIRDAGLYPADLLSWPYPETCFNQVWMAPTNEFTVSSPMGEILVISAYLAQMEKEEI